MKKSPINLACISAVLAVSSVCIMAESIYFRKLEISSSKDNCSDFVARVGTALSAAKCGADCSRNGQCRGFLYDHVTTACKDVYRDNIVDPECQADDGADYYSVCDRFLVTGPYGVADNQLDESTNWCASRVRWVVSCQQPGAIPTSAKFARLNSTGPLTGSWIAGVNDKQQHIEVDFLKPKIVAQVVLRSRDRILQYVSRFKFLYSDDCSAYDELTNDNGNILILEGNSNTSLTVVRDLPRRVKARCFRINPVTWFDHISMRFDLIGCP